MKKQVKSFDTVAFFREIKKNLAKMMAGMNLSEKKDFMLKVREGKIKIN
jgi:hypothetical protein